MKKSLRQIEVIMVGLLVLLLWCPGSVRSATIDLGGSSGTSVGVTPAGFDEALFQLADPGPAFSGGIVDVNSSATADLTPTGADLQFTTISGVAYATFQLDMNEQGKKDGFTIDAFTISSGGSILWDLGDNTLNVEPTSTITFENNGRVQIYVPASAFSEIIQEDTLAVNIDLGSTGAAVDSIGLAVGDGTSNPIPLLPPIPEPSTIFLVLLSAGLLPLRRRR